MNLKYQQDHLSIKKFNDVELQDFTVLTGVNGSGKSHLLQAIDQKKVIIEGYENANIVLFNYETFKLENESSFSAHAISQEREQAWNFFTQNGGGNIKNIIQSWKNNLGTNYQIVTSLCEEKKENLFSLSKDDISNDAIFDQLKSYKQNIKNHFKNNPNLKDNQQAHAILTLIKKLPFSIDEIKKEDFIKLYKPFYYKNDFLPQQLGKVIWDYYIRYDRNEYNVYENATRDKNYPVLSESDFIKIYGDKPWEVINTILSEFDSLKYTINSPEGFGYHDNFQLKLINKEENLEISFEHLSSGERVLMALVASIYKSSSDNHFPDILLLDEIDASLHPSMMKNLLSVINNVFLEKNVKIILVTHSPSTIALTPEESVFVMNENGVNRIEKKSKEDALEILTEGFATLREGLKFFDEVAKNKLTIITEGKNTEYIKKYLELQKINDVDVLTGVEGKSGETQLKTLYDFFIKIPHDNEVLFVWDCDVSKYKDLEEKNKTNIFVFNQNGKNLIAKKGIENLFSEDLFTDEYVKEVTIKERGVEKTEKTFPESQKNNFLKFILNKNQKEDFSNFEPLSGKIEALLEE